MAANEDLLHNDILSRLDPKVVASALERHDMPHFDATNHGDVKRPQTLSLANLAKLTNSSTLHPNLCNVQSSPASSIR